MKIQMAGIDHNKAAVEYRELFSFTQMAAEKAMKLLKDHYGVQGCVLLSTCNRTELWVSGDTALSPAELLCRLKGMSYQEYSNYFTMRSGKEAAEHLYLLTCGMKSRVFGEDQIITQVKDSLTLARECGSADSVLERLFRGAITTAKKVKTNVRISASDQSVADKMLEALNQHFDQLNGVHCMVIGNGEMGRLAAKTLVEAGCLVYMTLRRYKMGDVIIPGGCRVVNYEDRLEHLKEMQVIVSATTSPHHTLKYEETAHLLQGTRHVLIDLAVPRDISSRLGNIPGITLYDIDKLGISPPQDRQKEEIDKAHGMIGEELEEFCSWYEFRDLVPVIQRIETLAAADMNSRVYKTIGSLELDDEERRELQELVENASMKVVGKLVFGLREHLSRDKWKDCIESLEKAAQPKEQEI